MVEFAAFFEGASTEAEYRNRDGSRFYNRGAVVYGTASSLKKEAVMDDLEEG
jgi:hypothetical protein